MAAAEAAAAAAPAAAEAAASELATSRACYIDTPLGWATHH